MTKIIAKDKAAKRAAKKAAEKAARQLAWEKACKAVEEANKIREKETQEKKEFLLSKVSENNKVFETIVIDDAWSPTDGEKKQENHVFDKENMIKIIERFPNDLSWNEESQEFQIKLIWWDTQDWRGTPSVTDVATPINTAK